MQVEGVAEGVLTGGAAGGKTTAKPVIFDRLKNIGYRVWFAPEAATMLFDGGITDIGHIAANDPIKYLNIERQLLLMQRALRERINGVAACFQGDKRVAFFDRAEMDIQAFIGLGPFNALLKEQKLNLHDVRDSYDAVFHLVTAADGAEKFYTLENNAVRRETPEEARASDIKIQYAWTGTPHLKIIDNSVDFEHKMNRLIQAVYRMLGVPVPFEIERKFLLKGIPDFSLDIFRNAQRIDVEQFYLISSNDEEVRVRRRTQEDSSTYFKTKKRRISDLMRHETERFIRAIDYLEAHKTQLPRTRIIRKDRYCFIWRNQYFELDVFRDPPGLCLLEIELTEENDQVELPPGLAIEREVTDDKTYSNRALAEARPHT